jgi:hypothetical protein
MHCAATPRISPLRASAATAVTFREFDERHNDLWVIGYRIFETPANTIEGMAVKLRVGETLDNHHCEENEAWTSIAGDVARRSRGVVAKS